MQCFKIQLSCQRNLIQIIYLSQVFLTYLSCFFWIFKIKVSCWKLILTLFPPFALYFLNNYKMKNMKHCFFTRCSSNGSHNCINVCVYILQFKAGWLISAYQSIICISSLCRQKDRKPFYYRKVRSSKKSLRKWWQKQVFKTCDFKTESRITHNFIKEYWKLHSWKKLERSM